MALPRSIEQARRDLEHTLTDPTPLYAVVGIADAAAARLRSAREDLATMATGARPQQITELARGRLLARVGAVQSDVAEMPRLVRAIPGRAQSLVDDTLTGAVSAYTGLAARGKTFVDGVRGQEETGELQRQAKATVTKAKAARTATQKATAANTRATAKAATAGTKKSASTARAAAKSTVTSSKKTATATKRAAKSSARKLGT
jgi:heparin binding hemagglutinin HbhA